MIFTAKKFSLSISIEHETRQIPLRRWLGLFKHNLRSRNSLKHICMCFQVKRKDISSESKRQKKQFHDYVKPIWIDHGPRGNWVRGEGPVKKFGGKEFCLERMPGIGIITKCFPNVSYWEGSHFSICIFTDIVFKQICILTTLGRCSFGHPIHLKCLIVAAGGWCILEAVEEQWAVPSKSLLMTMPVSGACPRPASVASGPPLSCSSFLPDYWLPSSAWRRAPPSRARDSHYACILSICNAV